MKRAVILLILSLIIYNPLVQAQQSPRPKLIVGIVVDQMTYDILYRYWDNYSDDGFRRLVRQGFSCENTHYNYVPTYTGPGHASVYTGSVPAVHGIVANHWYDKYHGNWWYCAQDTTVQGLGTGSSSGQMSPRNLLTTTITDQLKLAMGEDAKVIGVALKDRGAILPAGHAADAAYWFDGYANAWISSTYYGSELPAWVSAYNEAGRANELMANNWELFLSPENYVNSTADAVPWESVRSGENAPVFPHRTDSVESMEAIKGTPFGNTLTIDFARAALEKEGMGLDPITDFLCISFSSTDYVGHAYGPYSMETEDTYLRLDRDLGDFLRYLDSEIGEDDYLVFLTSDHGVAPTPGYMQSLGIPAGLLNDSLLVADFEAACVEAFGQADWILEYGNQQVFLNHEAMEEMDTDAEEIAELLQQLSGTIDGVARVTAVNELGEAAIPALYRDMFINGIYPARCGDLLVTYDPNWIEYGPAGSTHGSHFAYDSHVPLLWYGWKIPNGKTWNRVDITDIAPTLAAMLRIAQPNGCVGRVIDEMK